MRHNNPQTTAQLRLAIFSRVSRRFVMAEWFPSVALNKQLARGISIGVSKCNDRARVCEHVALVVLGTCSGVTETLHAIAVKRACTGYGLTKLSARHSGCRRTRSPPRQNATSSPALLNAVNFRFTLPKSFVPSVIAANFRISTPRRRPRHLHRRPTCSSPSPSH